MGQPITPKQQMDQTQYLYQQMATAHKRDQPMAPEHQLDQPLAPEHQRNQPMEPQQHLGRQLAPTQPLDRQMMPEPVTPPNTTIRPEPSIQMDMPNGQPSTMHRGQSNKGQHINANHHGQRNKGQLFNQMLTQFIISPLPSANHAARTT
jgi:hypothetical protein